MKTLAYIFGFVAAAIVSASSGVDLAERRGFISRTPVLSNSGNQDSKAYVDWEIRGSILDSFPSRLREASEERQKIAEAVTASANSILVMGSIIERLSGDIRDLDREITSRHGYSTRRDSN